MSDDPSQDDTPVASDENSQPTAGDSFPVADTTEGSVIVRSFGLSRMWLVSLACLFVAIGMVWFSIDESGPTIELHFKQGYGLKPGDALRHRGIDIGKVVDVRLSNDLSGITVKAEPEAHR